MKETIKKYIQKLPKRKVFHFEGFCANCEHPVNGSFCSNCGQSVKDFHRPFFSVLSESLGDALSLDNKFLHTIVPLFVRPGYLTKEFMRGKRARYTPPFRLYLFLTFFAFLLLSYNHRPETMAEKNLTFTTEEGKDVDVLSYFEDMVDENKSQIDSLESDSLTNSKLKKGLFNFNISQDTAQTAQSITFGEKGGKKNKFGNSDVKRVIDMWKLNPTLMMDNVYKKLSQTLLIILPVFALFLALFYIRRKNYLLEHLLISLNFHSFIFVIVIVSELLIMTKLEFVHQFAFYLYLLIPIQLFLALKFYYQQSWIKTIVKFFMLSFIYNILLVSGILYSLISLVVE
ncbi:DUF3667 domain-containing protein [Labilibaculum sp. K2S]|uniref:DUF3667 domain-containing protein n=1 Tax=Labilibaculum sp. K2S TaxID=3056386 RepID=UPI0025A45150|nr:DUF3667 domain-containing protein [Labilibaculum sp. K2S]MDM8159275.1 DUF3667 domain-containing protein [Labilibaculum sp. K2S]